MREQQMWIGRLVLALVLGTYGACGLADTILVDDFDGSGVGVASRVINPASGTFNTTARMFDVGNRAMTLPNRTPPNDGLPFAMSDDSVVPAAGNTQFPADAQGIFGQAKTDSFFGVVDVVDATNPNNNMGVVTWTVDTANLSNLKLHVDVGAMGDFEAADHFDFSASFDGGANFTPVMTFGADEAIDHTYRLLDAQLAGSTPGTLLNDPMDYLGADGILGGGDDLVLDKTDPTTGALDTLTANITGTGPSMILRFSAVTDGISEAFAFDNVKLSADSGTPTNNSDFNSDGKVDGADFLIWQKGQGLTGQADKSTGDATGDGLVNDDDLTNWKNHYGGAGVAAAVSAVPEPATAVMMLLGLAAAVAKARRS